MTARPFTLWRSHRSTESVTQARRALNGAVQREREYLLERDPASPRVKPSLPKLRCLEPEQAEPVKQRFEAAEE